MNAGRFASGFVIGALLGTTAAMLLAPDTDEDGKGEVRSALARTTERLREAADAMSERSESLAEDVTAGATGFYARGKRIVDEARAHVESAVAEGRAAAELQRTALEQQT